MKNENGNGNNAGLDKTLRAELQRRHPRRCSGSFMIQYIRTYKLHLLIYKL